MSKIIVVGSSNTDLIIRSPYFPRPGETVIGSQFRIRQGGKGANQAVAASRLGGEVCFIAKVGNDNYGDSAVRGFLADNIQTDYVFRDDELSTGVAIITINNQGQNTIIVDPGANQQLSSQDIAKSIKEIETCSFILIQLEIPIAVVEHIIELAVQLQKKVILNPAPATRLKKDVYHKVYLTTPNETEASLLTGVNVNDALSVSKAADIFLADGVENVIITLGDKGAYFKNKSQEFHIPANKVKVSDTTAAGDVFNGALAVSLTEGKNWKQSISFASHAASISVSRFGAQSSIPFRHEVDTKTHKTS